MQKPLLQQIRLVHLFERALFFADRGRDGLDPDRAAVELFDDRFQQQDVHAVEAGGIDLQIERGAGDLLRDDRLVLDLGVVAHAAQQTVGDARRAARPAGDFRGAVRVGLYFEDGRGAADDVFQFGDLVEIQPERGPETVAQRRRQESGARRRAHQREAFEPELHRPRGRPLADDEVELEILHRRIQKLFDHVVEPVDLVDEQHVAFVEIGQDGGQVPGPLDRRAGDRPDRDLHLVGDDVRERRLAQSGRAAEQDVIQHVVALLGRFQRDPQRLLGALLADVFIEAAGAQRAFDVRFVLPRAFRSVRGLRVDQAARPAVVHGVVRAVHHPPSLRRDSRMTFARSASPRRTISPTVFSACGRL